MPRRRLGEAWTIRPATALWPTSVEISLSRCQDRRRRRLPFLLPKSPPGPALSARREPRLARRRSGAFRPAVRSAEAARSAKRGASFGRAGGMPLFGPGGNAPTAPSPRSEEGAERARHMSVPGRTRRGPDRQGGRPSPPGPGRTGPVLPGCRPIGARAGSGRLPRRPDRQSFAPMAFAARERLTDQPRPRGGATAAARRAGTSSARSVYGAATGTIGGGMRARS